jgi:ketosteroid isomerase-like protein
MDSANVEFVRSIYADWERGDFSRSDWAHPEIEYEIVDGPAPGSWKGVSAMNAAWREFASAWKDVSVQSGDFRELDRERVVCLAHFSARGKTSDLDVGQVRTRSASLWHVHGGKVTRLVIYWTADRALADLGLGPEGDAR